MDCKTETTDFELTEFLFGDLLECFDLNELNFLAHALDVFSVSKDISARDRSFMIKYARVFFQEVLKRKTKNVRT